MPTSNASRIKASERFKRSLKQLFKSHYRKNAKGKTALIERLASILDLLEHSADLQGMSRVEGWPSGGYRAGWTYYKLAFGMDGLHGAAAQGRLLYLHHSIDNAIVLVWVYTHSEFETQPPKHDLLTAMFEALELGEAED